MRRPVPEVPPEITGPCVYGHILTEEHIVYFRHNHPDIPEWQSSDLDSLVSFASDILPGRHTAHTAHVLDSQGKAQICLMLVGHRNRSRLNDWRWEDGFMTSMEELLGITEKPNWYACRRRCH